MLFYIRRLYWVLTIIHTNDSGVINMRFVNIKELSQSPSKYIKMANEKDDIIITRNGHPYAILSKIAADELEDYILAKHFNLDKEFNSAKKEYALGKTTNVNVLLKDRNSKSNEI